LSIATERDRGERQWQSGRSSRRFTPGEVLREDYLIPAGMTVNALALRVPVSRMYDIVNCRRAITPETALRLARHLGTSPEFWLGLQSDYDLEKAQEELAERIQREVQPRQRAA
jgi:addiction module HigA family antidote